MQDLYILNRLENPFIIWNIYKSMKICRSYRSKDKTLFSLSVVYPPAYMKFYLKTPLLRSVCPELSFHTLSYDSFFFQFLSSEKKL